MRDRHRGRRASRRPTRTGSGGRWARGARAARWRSSIASSSMAACASPGMTEEDRRGAVPPGRRVRQLRVRQVACGGVRPDGLRIGLPQALLPGPVPGRADQRPADGLLPGRGPGQRREAPRRGGPAGRHQRVLVQDHDRMGGTARRAAAARGPGIDGATGADPVAGLRRARPRRRASAGRPRSPPAGASASGLHLVKGIGEQHQALLDAELARGPYASLADVVERTGLPEEVARAAHPDRWRWTRWAGRGASCCGSSARWPGRHAVGSTDGRCAPWAGRPASVARPPAGRWTCGCPPTEAPDAAARSPNRSGSAMPTR